MPIEARVKTTIEAYNQKLQSYEQALAEAMQREYPLSQATQERLQKMQQVWKLTDKDIASLENRVTAERETYRQKLQQYEQVFTRATQQEYPLSEVKRNELQQHQQILGLKDEDIAPIAERITAEIQAYQQKLRQYEQVLRQLIQYEYPISDENRKDLQRFQQTLNITNLEVSLIEERVFKSREVQPNQQPVQEQKAQTIPNVKSIAVPEQVPKSLDASITKPKTSQQIPWKVVSSLAGAAITAGIVIQSISSEPSNSSSESQQSSNNPSFIPTKLDLGGNLKLSGAGASYPAPLYDTWFTDLNKKYPNLQVDYASVGSGAGVEQFIKGTVDFGASDVAMKDEEIQRVPADRGVILLPVTAGSIVLAYNLPDVAELKLPRAVYVDILLGKITSWDDPQIAKANPDAKLPKQAITVVYRSDGSGTTGVFTKHLSAISPEWKTKVGEGKTVNWPRGVGAKGNEGVTAQIQQTQGSIGYVEYGYAKQNSLKFAALENKGGKFIVPSEESASKTLASVTLPPDLRVFISDPEGADSYPIVTYTWILAYKKYPNAARAKAVEAAIEYALTEGQKQATTLGYVPLPQNVIAKVAAAADQISPEYKISIK
jgi:phosphate transport system substrate-binding protein